MPLPKLAFFASLWSESQVITLDSKVRNINLLEYTVSQLTGGSSQYIWLLTNKKAKHFSKVVVKKITDNDSNAFGFLSFADTAPLTQSSDVFPQVIATNSIKGYAFFSFIEGSLLSDACFSQPQRIDVVSRLMTEIHAVGQTVKSLYQLPRLDLRHYLTSLLIDTNINVPINEFGLTFNIDIANTLTFCHGDLNWGNVIVGDRPYAIDWDYMAIAPIEYDLAMVISINQLSRDDSRLLIESYTYCSLGNTSVNCQLLQQYIDICDLINGLWYLKQAALNQCDSMRIAAIPFLAKHPCLAIEP